MAATIRPTGFAYASMGSTTGKTMQRSSLSPNGSESIRDEPVRDDVNGAGWSREKLLSRHAVWSDNRWLLYASQLQEIAGGRREGGCRKSAPAARDLRPRHISA
eukprot:497076-Rhodomonas_salina.1